MSFFNDALSSPYVGFGLGAISSGMSAAGAYRDAKAQQAANELNAQTFEQNANLSRLLAQNERDMGAVEYADVRRQFEMLRGEQAAAYGASGVAVNAGSAAATVANTAAEGVYEAQKAQYSRELSAWQMEQEAANYDFEAKKARASGPNPYVAATTAAIGGLTNTFATFGSWKRNGLNK